MFLCLALCFSLTACHGLGLSSFDSEDSWTTETPEDKAEESWWDHFWGRKENTPESAAWKGYYSPPNSDGNCDFYGNCKSGAAHSGW